jgi:hypothetical protein
MSEFLCLVCKSKQASLVENGVSLLGGVTSDCKPWPRIGIIMVCENCHHVQKKVDLEWQSDVSKIYDNYKLYHLSDGAEQIVFEEITSLPRSVKLVEHLCHQGTFPQEGHLLDVGCGNVLSYVYSLRCSLSGNSLE